MPLLVQRQPAVASEPALQNVTVTQRVPASCWVRRGKVQAQGRRLLEVMARGEADTPCCLLPSAHLAATGPGELSEGHRSEPGIPGSLRCPLKASLRAQTRGRAFLVLFSLLSLLCVFNLVPL